MSTSFSVTLTPNDFDLRTKAHSLGEREWPLGVELVDKAGFRPNIVGGIDKRDVGPFAWHLAQALHQERLSDPDRQALDGLLGFLNRGAGHRGVAISRGWKKWNKM